MHFKTWICLCKAFFFSFDISCNNFARQCKQAALTCCITCLVLQMGQNAPSTSKMLVSLIPQSFKSGGQFPWAKQHCIHHFKCNIMNWNIFAKQCQEIKEIFNSFDHDWCIVFINVGSGKTQVKMELNDCSKNVSICWLQTSNLLLNCNHLYWGLFYLNLEAFQLVGISYQLSLLSSSVFTLNLDSSSFVFVFTLIFNSSLVKALRMLSSCILSTGTNCSCSWNELCDLPWAAASWACSLEAVNLSPAVPQSSSIVARHNLQLSRFEIFC